MELDFGSIRFCGRYKEVQQLNLLLDQVRGGLPGTPGTNLNNNRTPTHHGVGGFGSSSSRHSGLHSHHPHRSDGSVVSQNSSCSVKPCHKVVTIEGPGGTGKSMLVEHFLASIAEKQRLSRPSLASENHHLHPHHDTITLSTGGGSSASGSTPILVGRGKFEESSTMPFSSFAECISSLLDDLMSIDPDWCESLTADTRREIRSLSSIVPNLKTILDANRDEAASTVFTGSSSDTSGSQSGRQWAFERARMSFRTLIRTICSQYTVVLLLDDLQWASDDCVKLVKAVLTDPQASNLLLLATHRELGPSSPAFNLKNDIPTHILTRIRLGDLSPMDICDVVESLLGGRDAEEEDIQGLSLLVHSKTGGTIFVVVQFLRMLYERELITYSFHRLRWEFSLDRISSETSIYGNVLQLVCDKISKLPKPLQVPLITAAFLGFSSFDVSLLYHVLKGSPIYPAVDDVGFQMILEECMDSNASGMSLLGPELADVNHHHDPINHYMDTIQDSDELRAILQMAVKEGLLEKIPPRHGDDQQLLFATRGECYRFSHDRVREGALTLISQHQFELQTMHLQMGLELRRIREDNVLGGDEEELERLLLHAVRHLNEGMSMANASVERVELSRMNLEAATVVIDRSAFPSALEFLQTGLGLLDEETKWTENYHLTLQLSDKVTQVRFCTGQHEDNWKTLYDVLEHGRSTNDKLNAYRTLILSLATEGRFDEAIATNLAVLEKLGVSLPRNFIKVHMAQALSKVRRRTKGRTEEEIFVYRDNVDVITRFQCEFLGTLSETCSLSGHDDYRVLGMVRATDYIIDNGIEELAPMAMIGCAYQYGMLGDVEKSYRFGKLAAKIAMEGKNPRNDGKAIALAYECPIALKEPYHKCLDSLLTAFKFILDNGEIEHLYLPIYAYSTMYFHCGLRLEPLKSDVLRFIDMLESFGQTSHLNLYKPFVELVVNMMGSKDSEDYRGRPFINLPKGTSSQAMQHYYRYEMILSFFLDDVEMASDMSSRLNSPKVEGPSSWLSHRFFYQGLIEYALCRKSGKSKHRRRGLALLQKLEEFVKSGHVNCQHMVLLLRAEHLSLGRGAIDTVQQAYDKAIVSCGKLGFLHGQGLANELAGIHFLERGDRSWASTYLARSYGIFRQWGALSKAYQMEGKYGELVNQRNKDPKPKHGSFIRGVPRAQGIVDSSSNLGSRSARPFFQTQEAQCTYTGGQPLTSQSGALHRLSFQPSY